MAKFKLDRKRVIVSAPGKVILFGEHAVVYGKRAIAAALDKRTYLSIEALSSEQRSPALQLDLLNFDVSITIEDSYDIENDTEELDDKLVEKMRKGLRENCCVSEESPAFPAILSFLYLYNIIRLKSTDKCNEYIRVQVFSNLPVGAGLGSSASFSVCAASGLLIYYGLVCGKEYLPHQKVD